MPEISRFFGIVVRMYFDDHHPPHFHAFYAEMEALIGINEIEMLAGDLPNRALSMILEWAAIHRRELIDNWNRLQSNEQAVKIDPLE